MKILLSVCTATVALILGSCGREGGQCERLSRADALRTARQEKAGMLRRSTAEVATNFGSDTSGFVKVGLETNGYAANVGFKGRDGRTLIALIEDDCYVGWTYE